MRKVIAVLLLCVCLAGCEGSKYEVKTPEHSATISTFNGPNIEIHAVTFEGRKYTVFSSTNSNGGVFAIEEKETAENGNQSNGSNGK